MKKRNDSKVNMRYVNLVGEPEKRWYQKKKRKIQVAVFAAVLIVGMVISLIIPLRPTVSASEKRELAKFPEFSFAALADGSYFKGIDTWFSDTFPFREALTSANSKLTSWYGFGNKVSNLGNGEIDEIPDVPTTSDDDEPESTTQQPTPTDKETTSQPTQQVTEKPTENDTTKPPQQTQTLGGILVAGNSAYEYYNFVQKTADSYAKHINYLAKQIEKSGTNAQIYDILVPTSIDITLDESTRKSVNTSDQQKAINYIYGSMTDKVKTVNIYDTLKQHSKEYLYYRTDHHWTALGAYYAYEKFCQDKGITAIPLSQYDEKNYGKFLGSFYNDTNKNKKLEKHADELIVYQPRYKTEMEYIDTKGNRVKWPLVNDVTNYASSYKYGAFAGGDNPYTRVVNSDIKDKSTCLVIKESFGNAMIPFIAGNYHKVYVIDYRTWKGTVSEFVKSKGVQDVIFINNMSATRAEPLVGKIGEICK